MIGRISDPHRGQMLVGALCLFWERNDNRESPDPALSALSDRTVSCDRWEIAPDQYVRANSDQKSLSTFSEFALARRERDQATAFPGERCKAQRGGATAGRRLV